MVLGKDEPSDISFENDADLIINGRRFENQNVTGDTEAPKRRDVFPSSLVLRRYPDNLPQQAMVVWQGRRYMADLSFRTRTGGGRVPVYEFYVESRATR